MVGEKTRRGATTWRAHLLWTALVLLLVCLVGWVGYVAEQIRETAHVDQVAPDDGAQSADAIAVFGAAQYGGRPSPVLHLRLDHAVELYRRRVAPVIVTLGGGSDRDSGRTEGGVGRDYLLAQGVPLADIIAETQSRNTVQQVHRLAAIARDHNWHRIVVVSDATHMFRLRALCEAAGLDVVLSPRTSVGHLDAWSTMRRSMHEIVSYTVERVGWESGDDD